MGGKPSDYQLAVIKEVCEQSWRDNDTIRSRMEGNDVPYGEYLTYCQADLLGIIYNETVPKFDCGSKNQKGENSHGCYQINMDVHCKNCNEQELAEKIENAYDLRWAAAWTLNRIVIYGWRPRTINGQMNRHAVQCHNGCYANNGYALKAVEMSNFYIEEYSL